MDSFTNKNSLNKRCRIRLVMEMDEGGEVAIDLDETLEGATEGADVLRLRNRIFDRLENRLMARFKKQLWDWTESRLPREEGTFEEEFARRCDRNDDVIESLEWLSPHIPSDEERDWQDCMVEILMSRQANEMAR
jgi:hypothetical protein